MRLLLELYFTFFRIGIVTFGGGLTMLPILERVLVNDKNWTTQDDLLDYYSIAQTTPGIIAVNVATFVGHKLKGIAGGFSATLGMVTPSLIIITFIALCVSNFQDYEWVQKAMKGINAAVTALLTYSVVSLCRKNLKKWWSFLLFGFAFVAMFVFHLHTLFITLTAVVFGIIIHVCDKSGKSEKDGVK